MWALLQGAFFRGGALLLSVIVIVLGVARLSGNTYVTPIFDTAAWHTLRAVERGLRCTQLPSSKESPEWARRMT